MYRILITLALLILVTSCRVGPAYPPPVTPEVEQWKHPSDETAETPDVDYWWEIFNDSTLNNLEEIALDYNKNLYIALDKVAQARALIGVTGATLYPQLSLNPQYSDQDYLSVVRGPGAKQLKQQNMNIFYRSHEFLYTLPLNLNWEIDLWGAIRNQYLSTIYSYEAQIDAYNASLLILTADVASVYYQIRALDSALNLYRETIQTRQKAYQINKDRYDYKLTDFLAVSQAGLDLSNVQSLYYDAVRQRELLIDALATLLGQPASTFTLDTTPFLQLPPKIPAGIPSDILVQRPDIAQAERTRAAQHVLIGTAYAAFLPSLSLTGTLGYSSPDLHHFLQWSSRWWAMGAQVGQSIFDGGRNCANLELAWAQFRETDNAYQQIVLVAFQEVEDALANIEGLAKEADSVQEAVDFAQKSYQIAMDRYLNGVDFYLQVVDNERQLLDNQRALVSLLEQRYLATIQLIKALGGRWSNACAFTD